MQQTAQINVRIKQELKQCGDAVFAEAGLTSSEAIRLLYTFAANHQHQPELIVQRLAGSHEDEESARWERRLTVVKRARGLYGQALAELGINNPDTETLNMSYDLLKEAAFAEKYGIGTANEEKALK